MSWSCQSASYWLSDSLGLSGGRFCPLWQLWAARVHLTYSVTAWGFQGAHNGPCNSLGWQGGNHAFSTSFLILNEIMHPALAKSAFLVRNFLQCRHNAWPQQRAARSERSGPRWKGFCGRKSGYDLRNHRTPLVRVWPWPQEVPPRQVPGQDPGHDGEQLRVPRTMAQSQQLQKLRSHVQRSLLPMS